MNVGPRDGLQNELTVLEPETRAELVNRLASAGLRRIEVTSFVSAARVPQMADAEAVVQGVVPNAAIEYAGLVLNGRGCERLRATGVDRVHFALAVTETFNRRSAGASVADSLAAATEILGRARGDGLGSTVTLAVAFGCPFEGGSTRAGCSTRTRSRSSARPVATWNTFGSASTASMATGT